jgi:hypothetical protein
MCSHQQRRSCQERAKAPTTRQPTRPSSRRRTRGTSDTACPMRGPARSRTARSTRATRPTDSSADIAIDGPPCATKHSQLRELTPAQRRNRPRISRRRRARMCYPSSVTSPDMTLVRHSTSASRRSLTSSRRLYGTSCFATRPGSAGGFATCRASATPPPASRAGRCGSNRPSAWLWSRSG